jgi:hypothetical protein
MSRYGARAGAAVETVCFANLRCLGVSILGRATRIPSRWVEPLASPSAKAGPVRGCMAVEAPQQPVAVQRATSATSGGISTGPIVQPKTPGRLTDEASGTRETPGDGQRTIAPRRRCDERLLSGASRRPMPPAGPRAACSRRSRRAPGWRGLDPSGNRGPHRTMRTDVGSPSRSRTPRGSRHRRRHPLRTRQAQPPRAAERADAPPTDSCA